MGLCLAYTEPQREHIRKIAEELDAHRKRVQAQHPGLTLTGMYNVLAQLRASQPLTPKEKDIHDKALVSVLKQLHDDLDAAVFEAYNWPRTLTDAEILERLVALNAERAREEAAGHIRWLRPDYQIPLFSKTPNRNPNLNLPPGGTRPGAKRQTLTRTGVLPSSAPELALPTPKPKKQKLKKAEENPTTRDSAAPNSKLPKLAWPKSLPDRTKAVLLEIDKRGSTPFTPEEIARSFNRAQVAHVAEILETLCTFGRAHPGKEKGTYTK